MLAETSGGLPAPTSSPPILYLAGVDLGTLNDNMKRWSDTKLWSEGLHQIGRARDDSDDSRKLFSEILMCLTHELAETDLKNSVIAPASPWRSHNIVIGFSDEELQQWKAGMRSGVETNDWAGLIKHPKLRSSKVENVAPDVPIEYQNAVIRAWSLEYHGDAHEILLKAIDNLHAQPIEDNHAKFIPIVQSSGTGKSRTVDKVATMRILFPLCLRENIGTDSFAYPPIDRVVRDHFLLAPAAVVACKRHFRSFLSALFAMAHLRAQEFFPGRKVSYEFMAMAFHGLFANPQQRREFYEAVVQKAQKTAHGTVWNSFNELKDSLKECCIGWPPPTLCPVLISIDEVHILYTNRGVSIDTLYSSMKSVLDEGVSYDFGVISLSTRIYPSSLAPSNESMRGRDGGRILPAPFTELPFDVYVINEPLVPGRETLASVGSLEFTAKFGRPLFYSSYLSRRGESNIIERIMRNVRQKVSGRSWPPQAPADIDASSIAILSARLLLDLSATASAKRYEEELVRNHLRMLYSVQENCQTIVTGSSPEPLIAEASAQIMNHQMLDYRLTIKEPYMDLWDLLGKFVDHGLAPQNAIGQLIGRALSISAMDHAINRLQKVCELQYQTPVAVADYYKALLTDEAWEALRRSTPANPARLNRDSAKKTFEDAFRDAYFHFSHYGKATDSSPMRDTHAWAIWLRGTAVACQPNQEPTDRMAPIYFSSRGNVSPDTISVSLDQDKTGQSVTPANAIIQSAEDLKIFSRGNELPYIAAVHCYALTHNQGIFVTQPSSGDTRNRSRTHNEEAPRYQFGFRGLSAYGNIADAVRTKIRTMINYSKDAMFYDHARKDGIDSLRRMLPMVTEDPTSMEWFSN